MVKKDEIIQITVYELKAQIYFGNCSNEAYWTIIHFVQIVTNFEVLGLRQHLSWHLRSCCSQYYYQKVSETYLLLIVLSFEGLLLVVALVRI